MTSNHSGKASEKIRDLDELGRLLGPMRAAGKKVVHCHGVFDLLHIGHIRHFEQAKRLGDVLVATVTPDRFVNKGPGRPAFNEDLRAEAIAALNCVDYVAINQWPLAVEAIKVMRPDFYVKGQDYRDASQDMTGGIALEEAAVKSVGGQITFTNDITFSASNLINRHLDVYPEGTKKYLADFSARFSADDVLRFLNDARTLKVLVVGETIIDEYLYCETIGKAGKEPVLAARYLRSERFAGGIIAGANHIAAFCDQPSLLTFLGGSNSHEGFIREKMNSKIDPLFLYMEGGAPTIVKRRFVETYPFQKLFELYIMDDSDHNPEETRSLCDKLNEILPNFDMVVVLDYGHGMLEPEVVDLLCERSRFLAVNTQVNAGNRGFNTISKYRRADFVCISENEIRLDGRSSRGDLRDIVLNTAEKLSCDKFIITKGQNGSLCYAKNEGFFEVPAFAAQVVDRIGAGDAVFAITSLSVVQNAPMEIAGFIGNAAGAEAVGTVGHRESIQHLSFSRHIEHLLK